MIRDEGIVPRPPRARATDGAWWAAMVGTTTVAVVGVGLGGFPVLWTWEAPPFVGTAAWSLGVLLLATGLPAAGAAALLLLERQGRGPRQGPAWALLLVGLSLGIAGGGLAVWESFDDDPRNWPVVVAWAGVVMACAGLALVRRRARWPLGILLWASPFAILLLVVVLLNTGFVIAPLQAIAALLCAWHARRARAGWDVVASP